MRIVKPSYEILTPISEGGSEELKHIEQVSRVCYKSEDKITENALSAVKLVQMLVDRGHEAMLEHSHLSVKFIVDRGVSHELVRHRIASFAQESTRYCNYSKEKFGREITVVDPCTLEGTRRDEWAEACKRAELAYLRLLDDGASPQAARIVLPTSLKTEVVVSTNYREWRNIFKLRTDAMAHPQMQEVMRPLLRELQGRIPVVFDDIDFEGNWHPLTQHGE